MYEKFLSNFAKKVSRKFKYFYWQIAKIFYHNKIKSIYFTSDLYMEHTKTKTKTQSNRTLKKWLSLHYPRRAFSINLIADITSTLSVIEDFLTGQSTFDNRDKIYIDV